MEQNLLAKLPLLGISATSLIAEFVAFHALASILNASAGRGSNGLALDFIWHPKLTHQNAMITLIATMVSKQYSCAMCSQVENLLSKLTGSTCKVPLLGMIAYTEMLVRTSTILNYSCIQARRCFASIHHHLQI